jgi:hypothetical protein
LDVQFHVHSDVDRDEDRHFVQYPNRHFDGDLHVQRDVHVDGHRHHHREFDADLDLDTDGKRLWEGFDLQPLSEPRDKRDGEG